MSDETLNITCHKCTALATHVEIGVTERFFCVKHHAEWQAKQATKCEEDFFVDPRVAIKAALNCPPNMAYCHPVGCEACLSDNEVECDNRVDNPTLDCPDCPDNVINLDDYRYCEMCTRCEVNEAEITTPEGMSYCFSCWENAIKPLYY